MSGHLEINVVQKKQRCYLGALAGIANAHIPRLLEIPWSMCVMAHQLEPRSAIEFVMELKLVTTDVVGT